jgi:hypothetical protein
LGDGGAGAFPAAFIAMRSYLPEGGKHLRRGCYQVGVGLLLVWILRSQRIVLKTLTDYVVIR